MTLIARASIAALVVAIDALFFFLPLAALLAAYILVARPPWFSGLVEKIYRESR